MVIDGFFFSALSAGAAPPATPPPTASRITHVRVFIDVLPTSGRMRQYNPQRMVPTPVTQNLSLSLVTLPPARIETDLLLVPVFETDSLDDIPELKAGSAGQIDKALASREVDGKPYELFIT